MSSPVKAVKNVVKKTVNVVTKVFTAVVNVAASVVSFVAEPFMGMLGGLATPDVPSGGSEMERQQGVLLQKQGSIVPIPVVYGYRKVGGTITFAETGSTDNKYLWVAYALSEGPVEGLHEIFIDDVQLNSKYVAKLNSGQTVTLDEGKFSGRVQLQFFHGTYYDLATSSPVGSTSILADAPSWNVNMKYNGVCVMFARYEWKKIVTQEDADNNPFGGSIPELQVSLLGRKVASLTRTDPQNYDWNEGARYSTNPAEILLDYMRHPRYGKGISNDQIDWSSWATAASKCNTSVTYIASGTKGPILTCNYVLDTSQTIFNNVKNLLMGFRAYMPYVQGKYKLKIEDAGHATNILSSQASIELIAVADPYGKAEYSGSTCDIIGDVTYTRTDRSAKYNQVTVTYVEPNKKWASEQVVYPEEESTRLAYIAEDGGYENKLEVAFPSITNYAIAKDMARLLFNKSRSQDAVSLKVTAEALELEPGDNIRIQARKLNFGTTAWRVISIKYNNDMTADLACVRNDETFYPYTVVGQQDIVKPPYIPKGGFIYEPVNFADSSVGLIPPKNSVIDTTPVDTVVNPVPTVPTTPGDDDESAGGGNTDTPVDNTPPTTPVEVPSELDATVDVFQTTFTKEGDYWFAELKFAQPISNYAGTVFYYKRNVNDTVYRIYETDDAPGVGNNIIAKIGPLQNVTYRFYSTVKYATGERSTKSANFTLTPSGGTTDPTEIIELTQSLDLSVVTYTSGRRDTQCEVRALGPYLNLSGSTWVPQPGSRYIWLAVGQNLDQPLNPDIAGLRIAYRQTGTDYWKQEDVIFDKGWYPGKQEDINPFPTIPTTGVIPSVYGHLVKFEPTNNGLGITQYPSAPGSTDNYDFIFKWLYNDGTPGEVHTRLMNVDVESGPLGFVSGSLARNLLVGKTPIYERESEYSYTLVDVAPPGSSGGNASDVQFGFVEWRIAAFNADRTQAKLAVILHQPNASDLQYWYGCYVRYRLYGQTAENTKMDAGYLGILPAAWWSRNVAATGDLAALNQIRYDIDVWFPVDQKIELRVTPWVSQNLWDGNYATSSFVPYEATYGIYGVGKLFASDSNRQWDSSQIKTESQYTDTDWNNPRTTSSYYQPNPAVQFQEAKIVLPYYNVQRNVPATGTNPVDYAYHQFTYNHNNIQSSDYKGVRIYARVDNSSLGETYEAPWEYWDVIDSNPSGNITVKLRLPISNSYFWKNPYNKTVGTPPYGLLINRAQYMPFKFVMNVAVRVIRQDDSLSDDILTYTYKVGANVTGIPPGSFNQFILEEEVTTIAFEDLNGFTDIGTKNRSQLNIDEAIAARQDTGTSASTNNFIDPQTGTKYYVKRWV
jgi:hypothetical protein